MTFVPTALGKALVGGYPARIAIGSISCQVNSPFEWCVCFRYAEKDGAMTFAPTALGKALVGGYRAMGLDWFDQLSSEQPFRMVCVF